MSEFLDYLKRVRPEIDDALDRLIPPATARPSRLHEAMRYSVFAGGKRVRPALLLLAGEALGSPRDALLTGGAALEMIHTYSLIHDDLPALDNDDLRRGRPTAHRRFDEATAILAGDALLTLGLTTLADAPDSLDVARRQRAASLVGRAIGSTGMIGGQVDDLAAEDDWPEDVDEASALLESIHRRKTGELLSVCLRVAGCYAGVSSDLDRKLEALGDAIGLLFQIGDDVIDVEGSDEQLGKTAGKDRAVRKLTYPGLFGLEAAKQRLMAVHDRARELVASLPERADGLLLLIDYLKTRDR